MTTCDMGDISSEGADVDWRQLGGAEEHAISRAPAVLWLDNKGTAGTREQLFQGNGES